MVRLGVATSVGVLLSVLMVAVAIDCGTSKSHNLYFGQRVWNDRLVYKTKVLKGGHWFRTVSADVNTGPLNKRITYLEAIDGNTDGNGGCGYLTTGGVGDTVAKLHLKSQTGHGLNFTINVYARL